MDRGTATMTCINHADTMHNIGGTRVIEMSKKEDFSEIVKVLRAIAERPAGALTVEVKHPNIPPSEITVNPTPVQIMPPTVVNEIKPSPVEVKYAPAINVNVVQVAVAIYVLAGVIALGFASTVLVSLHLVTGG